MRPDEARSAAETMLRAVGNRAIALMSDDPALSLREARSQARTAVRASRASRMSWKKFLDERYAEWTAANLKSASETMRRLRVAFAEFAELPLNDWSIFAVERWRAARLKAGTKAATINRDLDCLKAAFNRALAWRVIRTNPLVSVKRTKVDRNPIVRYLDAAEETRLRDALAARDDRRRAQRDSANLWRIERGYDTLPPFEGTYTDHLTPLIVLAIVTV
jgi:hypothetical protein